MKETGPQGQDNTTRVNVADLSTQDLLDLAKALKEKDLLKANEIIKINLKKSPCSSTDKMEIS